MAHENDCDPADVWRMNRTRALGPSMYTRRLLPDSHRMGVTTLSALSRATM